MEIRDLKESLEALLETKNLVIKKITRFVKLYDGKINFDDIESEEPNVIVPFHSDKLFWTEARTMCVETIRTHKDYGFILEGGIDGDIQTDCTIRHGDKAIMPAKDMDIEGLHELLCWLDTYEQDFERRMDEERFGKEYTTNEKYRDYLQHQCEPEERLMVTLYLGASERQRKNIPMSPRARFAIVLKEC